MNADIKVTSKDYVNWLAGLKRKIRSVQIKAAVKVNDELLNFYWELGAEIVEKQTNATWGDRFLDQLSKDLVNEFPEMNLDPPPEKQFFFEACHYQLFRRSMLV